MAKRRETAFSVAEWMPLDETFVRAKAALGSSALRDLHGRLISGRLPSALRWFENDGTERFEKLKPSFWTVPTMQEGYKIAPDGSFLGFSGEVWVRGLAAALAAARVTAPDNAILYFFVSRRESDKLYTVAAPHAGPEPESERRKPGPKSTKDWPLHVAGELTRIVVVEQKPVPPASYFAQFCENKLGYQPDLSAVQKLIKRLLG
jgi:hypothetical protein